MAKNIIQRISLEGGAAIKAQLDAIGAAGKKAFGDLQSAVQSNRGFGNVGAAIDAVKAKAAALGDSSRKLGGDLQNLGGTASGVASVFGITLAASITSVVAGVLAMVKANASAETSLQKAADAAGITTKEFQELTFAAGKVNLEQDDVTKVLTRLNSLADDQVKKNLNLAKSQNDLRKQFSRGELGLVEYFNAQRNLREKSEEEIDVFTRLGVSVTNSSGELKNSKELLLDFADALKEIPSQANRAQLALEVTGKKNSKFNALIAKGSEGIRAFEAEMERIAPATTPMQIAVGNRLTSAFNSLNSTIASTKTAIFTLFAPNETRLVKAFQELIVESRAKLIDMAAAIADKVTPIVDDLIAVMQGRDQDVKNNIILVIRDAIVSFATEAKNAITNIILPALAALLKVLDTVASAINGLFGTNLTGTQLAVAIVVAKAIGIFGLFTGAIRVAISALGLLATAFGPVGLAVAAIGFAIGFVLVRALQSVNWKGFADSAVATWEAIKASVAGVGTTIANAFNTAAIAVSNAWNTSVEFVKGLWNGLLDFFGSLPGTIGAFFVSVGDAIVEAFNTAIDTVKGFFEELWSRITSIFNSVIEKARQVAASVASIFSGGASGTDTGPGFAGGGYTGNNGVRRIAGVVHGKEYVQPARVVARPGVRRFMDTLRRNGGNLSDAIARFASGFESGGFVDALSGVGPRGMGNMTLAVAGAGGAGNVLHLHFPGGAIGPVLADDDVMNALKRKAITSKARSAGKRPNFVGA